MAARLNEAAPAMDRTRALLALLRAAPRDRIVAPSGQPFALNTHHGKVRKTNQDAGLVLTGRRYAGARPYLGAILCDGMGGLESGDEAADLATAAAGAILAGAEPLTPSKRMEAAIAAANTKVFDRFQGRAGATLAAVLIDDGQTVIGWVGDARVYAVGPKAPARLLTRDDTIAAEVERIEGASSDAMDSLLRAVGIKKHIDPHVLPLETEAASLLLLSDGVHRMLPSAFDWIVRHAETPSDLVKRLVAGASWEGGRDNASALAITCVSSIPLDDSGEVLAAWVDAQPRIWHVVRAAPRSGARDSSPERSGGSRGHAGARTDPHPPASRRELPSPSGPHPEPEKDSPSPAGPSVPDAVRTQPSPSRNDSKDDNGDAQEPSEQSSGPEGKGRSRSEQAPLTIQLGDHSEDKP